MSDNWKKLTIDQLRAELAEYARAQEPATAPPLPPDLDPGTRTPEQLKKVSDNWINYIMSRPPSTWTPAEREGVRVASLRAAQEGW